MSLTKEVKGLLIKDVKLEWRQRAAFNGIVLYIFMVIFVIFLSIQKLEPRLWNSLFWIILLFTAVNAIAKSFLQESRARDIYYYTIASPQAIMIAKIIYNLFLMLLLMVVGFLFYSLILGFPAAHPAIFFLAIFMGSIGFAVTFTMVSAIASRASNSTALMAILSFPIFIPMLMVLLNLSQYAVTGEQEINVLKNIFLLAAIDIVVVTLSLILFPYIWRD